MKTYIINPFTCLGGASRAAWACLGVASTRSRVLPALIAGLGLMQAGQVTAQTFTTLHSFTSRSAPFYTNSDGALPQAGLILTNNTLYGTAPEGGSSGNGTVFAVHTDGTGFTNLHNFTASSTNSSGVYTNSDGVHPRAGLILSGNTLYGTANHGGSSGYGTVFKVNADGTGFTNLYSFTAAPYLHPNSDGANPSAGVILSGNTLYGTATYGGSSGNGTVFAVHTDGTGFTNLHSFTYGISGAGGIYPHAGLILSGNTLYGTASSGGDSGYGTVFKVNTDGTDFTTLHNFTLYFYDGAYPYAGLILLGNTLFGTTKDFSPVVSSDGTVFAVNTNATLFGTGFTSLYNFTASSTNSSGVYTNSDGANPSASLILSGNTLYGTASGGGISGNGTVFSLSFAPQLAIIPSGTNVILTWPTNVAGFDYTGFTLQSTTNLVSPAVWSTVSPGPVVVNGQNAVTNPISGAQQFYRLKQ